MPGPLTIALTGGIGSGKSTLARMLAELGAGLIDLDAIARELTAAGGAAIGAIRAEFGQEALDPSGALDRARLRARVFAEPQSRARLEALLHPMIWQRARQTADALWPGVPYLLFEVALLTEASARAQRFDRIVVIDCPVELQVARALQRGLLDPTEVAAIVAAQPSRGARLALADDVVFNGASLAALQERAHRLHALYCGIASSRRGV